LGIGITFQAHAVKAPVALIAYRWEEERKRKEKKRKEKKRNLG
jgi:hypothetical protein